MSSVRELEIRPPKAPFLGLACERLGQSLLNPPNVKGWEGGESWISSSTLQSRANLARLLVLGVGPEFQEPSARGSKRSAFSRILKRMRRWKPDIDIETLTGNATTSAGAIAALCDRFLPIQPAESVLTRLRQYVDPMEDDGFDPGRPGIRKLLLEALHMILCLPESHLS